MASPSPRNPPGAPTAIPTTPFIISPTPPNTGTWSADLGVRDINNTPMTRVASAPTTGQYALTAAALGATASFATNVMTVTIAPTSGTFQVGQTITSAGVAPGTTITSLGTGSGGTGTYNLSTSPGTITAQATTGGVGYLFAAADVGKTVFISYQSTSSSTTSKSGTFVNSVMGNVPFFRCDFYDGLQGNATSMSLFQCAASKFSLGTKLDDFLTQELDFQAIQNAAGQVISIGSSQ